MNKLFLGLISIFLCLSSAIVIADDCLTDNGDGTLTDPNTGLIWQTCALGEIWKDNSCNGKPKELNWEEAIFQVKNNKFNNKTDWILPTQNQLESLLRVSCGRWLGGEFWSTSVFDNDSAWGVYFSKHGSTAIYNRNKAYTVLLVRSSKSLDFEIFINAYKNAVLDKEALSAFEITQRRNTLASFFGSMPF